SVKSGLFTTKLTETEQSAKLNHQITARELLMARAASTSTHDRGDAFNTGGLVDVSGRGTRRTTDVAATGTWTSILSNHLTHEARIQVASRQITQQPATNAPGILIAGVAEFGQPDVPLGHNRQHYIEGGDTLTVASRQHLIKTGFDVIRTAVDSSMSEGLAGLYVFSDLNAFAAQQPDSFRQAFGL